MYVKVCLGYEGGVPTAAHGEQRPLFGQLYTEKVRHVDVLQLWPLDFATNTRMSTTTKPLATLWRPTLSVVAVNEMSFGGLERVQLSGRRRWMVQRWLCEPMHLQDAKRREAECKGEKWRWA